MSDFLQTPDDKQAKWYSKRMVHVAAVISLVFLLVIIAVVTGFVVMAKEHEKSTRRIIEVNLTVCTNHGQISAWCRFIERHKKAKKIL